MIYIYEKTLYDQDDDIMSLYLFERQIAYQLATGSIHENSVRTKKNV